MSTPTPIHPAVSDYFVYRGGGKKWTKEELEMVEKIYDQYRGDFSREAQLMLQAKLPKRSLDAIRKKYLLFRNRPNSPLEAMGGTTIFLNIYNKGNKQNREEVSHLFAKTVQKMTNTISSEN